MTVADHQPVTILIDLLGMGVDVGRHLRLQGGDREHLPRSLAHDLIEHRTARLVGGQDESWDCPDTVDFLPVRIRVPMAQYRYQSTPGACKATG